MWKSMWKMEDSSVFLGESIFQSIQDYWDNQRWIWVISKLPEQNASHGLSKWLQRIWFCLIAFLYQFTSDYCSDYCPGNSCEKTSKFTF